MMVAPPGKASTDDTGRQNCARVRGVDEPLDAEAVEGTGAKRVGGELEAAADVIEGFVQARSGHVARRRQAGDASLTADGGVAIAEGCG